MNNQELTKQLQRLKTLQAPKHVQESIHQNIALLSDKHKGFYFPLFALQAGFLVAVFLVLIGVGSGVVVAAKGSHPGMPFFPVKQLLQKVAPQIVGKTPSSVPTPTVLPTSMSHKQKPHEYNKSHANKEVKGVATQEKEEHILSHHKKDK